MEQVDIRLIYLVRQLQPKASNKKIKKENLSNKLYQARLGGGIAAIF